MHSFETALYSICPIDKLTNLSASSRSHYQLCIPHAFSERFRLGNALQNARHFGATASWVKVRARGDWPLTGEKFLEHGGDTKIDEGRLS